MKVNKEKLAQQIKARLQVKASENSMKFDKIITGLSKATFFNDDFEQLLEDASDTAINNKEDVDTDTIMSALEDLDTVKQKASKEIAKEVRKVIEVLRSI